MIYLLALIRVQCCYYNNQNFFLADTRYGERNGPESPKGQVTASQVVAPTALHSQLQQTRDFDNRQSSTASTATKELDDLMAYLSDFKVNVTAAPTPSQARLSGDYAKPNKAKPASTSCKCVDQIMYRYTSVMDLLQMPHNMNK